MHNKGIYMYLSQVIVLWGPNEFGVDEGDGDEGDGDEGGEVEQ